MPIRIKTDLEFGDIFYIKSDPEQLEHALVGVVFLPGNAIRFRLSYLGEEYEVYDFETSKEKDTLKTLIDNQDAE